MGLREQAEIDVGLILEDGAYGFGWDITVIDPSSKSAPLKGFSNDIAQIIDPETGQAIGGRFASVAIRIGNLAAKGLGIPKGVTNNRQKPWLVKVADINGNNYTFKVLQSNPDRTIGIVTCALELYQ